MATIKQIMIQKGESQDTRSFSTSAESTTYNDEISGLGASNVQKALELISVKLASKNLDGNNKIDKVNPTGTGSLSLNRKDGSLVGENSAAVGFRNTASGSSSFAEGNNTRATGTNSHAAGSGTEASAVNSFAVGQGTHATNNESFAIGSNTTASGEQSFAGGVGTTAAAASSFAFGKNNIIHGGKNNSVAIGTGLNPTTSEEVVIGSYNNENATYIESKPSFVIGTGTESNHKDGFVVLNNGTAIASNDIQIRTGQNTVSLNELNNKVKEGFYKELTQRQYNALTEAEKNNGTVYYIKDSDPFDVAWDKVKLSSFGANDSSIKFGVDADGNFGYIKPGADSVIPFNANRSGASLMKMYAPKIDFFWGNIVEIKEIKE